MTEAQIDQCRGEGFIPDLKFVVKIGARAFFECPFCGPGANHRAVVSLEDPTLEARPIHCHETGRMAWIMYDDSRQDAIKDALNGEESKFRTLLRKNLERIESMTAEEAFDAWQSHGMPSELAEELATDPERFRRLRAAHLETGKAGNKFGGAYQ